MKKLSEWWHKSPTKKDRKEGFWIGLVGGFWLTLILLLLLLHSMSFLNLFLGSLGGAIVCSILGKAFPKV